MTETELAERLDGLELRYAHQEAAIQELTRTVLSLEQTVRALSQQLVQVERNVRAIQRGGDSAAVEERPPHY